MIDRMRLDTSRDIY